MPTTIEPTQRHIAINLIKRNGIMRLTELLNEGVNPATLSRLVGEGVLQRPSRGLYELVGAEIDIAHSLAEVAKRAPKSVICLTSALQYHEMTLQLPRRVWIAIGSKDRSPVIDYPPIRAVRFGSKAHAMGVETHRIDSVPVRIYNPAKSIVDCFRFRRRVGLDIAMEALRTGWRDRKAKPDDIAQYAKALRIWSVVRPYLETVVADD